MGMIFTETPLKGAYLIELTPNSDQRGFFCRTFCADIFKEMGLKNVMVQSNLSFSEKKYTLRGMHYQTYGHEEAKLIRCIKGRLLDVIIDLRPHSTTYCNHFSIELSSVKLTMIYVPESFAHGFITLENKTEAFYQVSNYYTPSCEKGIRWNDTLFNINWPTKNPVISEKDSKHPDFIPVLI